MPKRVVHTLVTTHQPTSAMVTQAHALAAWRRTVWRVMPGYQGAEKREENQGARFYGKSPCVRASA